MTADDLETYVRSLGYAVDTVVGERDQQPYLVVRDLTIPHGGLVGRVCDVAIQKTTAVPFVVPPAIHTRPELVAMNPAEPVGTQPSPIGDGWQYWSRRFDRPPTPRAIWTHFLTILSDPRWRSN